MDLFYIEKPYLYVLCPSSNGKSLTWAQNERSQQRPNLWKRISIHVKKTEEAEVNHTAIIKPFSKGPDSPVDTGSVHVAYEDESPRSPYLPSPPPFHAPAPGGLHDDGPRRGPHGREDGGAAAHQHALPAYSPGTPQTPGRRLPESRGGGGGAVAVAEDPGVSEEELVDTSGVGVGDIGVRMLAGQPQCSTIMDQISSVVHRFTANISELNTMMLPGSPPGGATTTTTTTTVCAAVPGPGTFAPGPEVSACGPPPALMPRARPSGSAVTAYAQVSATGSAASGENLRPMMYERMAGVCANGRRSRNAEELVALTPPSPFRDLSLGSNSDSPPPSLSPGSEEDYDQLLLRHYTQSSSSL